MKIRTIATVTGADRSGLLKQLAGFTHELEGKWLSSKVIHLAGQTAILLEIELPEHNLDALQRQFSAHPDITSQFTPPASRNDARFTLALQVDADDRAGLIHDITGAIHEMDINIVNFDSLRLTAADLGRTVFTATLELSAPTQIESKVLVEKLEALPGNVRAEAA
ncbi:MULTISPECIES: glycine cleavage system protein R [Ferrimonas]|uniref:glycine cleavage system protein R n=1 Tax=Ferrimonas TaxID=44011 RepID=UPI00041D03F4|nr:MULTISPECIES: ACT domain-containing protein [Ferrimonas]USD36521.1 hypothetical protein J8Z22_16075 [Ferrimonas sp. SCSIO 43195]